MGSYALPCIEYAYDFRLVLVNFHVRVLFRTRGDDLVQPRRGKCDALDVSLLGPLGQRRHFTNQVETRT